MFGLEASSGSRLCCVLLDGPDGVLAGCCRLQQQAVTSRLVQKLQLCLETVPVGGNRGLPNFAYFNFVSWRFCRNQQFFRKQAVNSGVLVYAILAQWGGLDGRA